MKLSEAIRLGAMLRPHGQGALLMDGKTCALGAACEAVGIALRERRLGDGGCDSFNDIRMRWPWLRSPALMAIWQMNDMYGNTREQIADFVETIEPNDATADAPTQAESVEVLS